MFNKEKNINIDYNNKPQEEKGLQFRLAQKVSAEKTLDSKYSFALREKMKGILPPDVTPERALELIAKVNGKNRGGYGR